MPKSGILWTRVLPIRSGDGDPPPRWPNYREKGSSAAAKKTARMSSRRLGSSVFYGWGIKNGQISILFPMVSLGYIWTMLWAHLFFGERITKQKFAAVGMILLGVVFVGLASS
jgi:multidrug transporter EmrE-like cation transporter